MKDSQLTRCCLRLTGTSPLAPNGTTGVQIPGIPTGTSWRVVINCTYDPPNQFAKPGFFDDGSEVLIYAKRAAPVKVPPVSIG